MGINRNTWRAGQVVGRAIKKWWNRKRPAPSRAPPAKRPKVAQRTESRIRQGKVYNEGTGGQYSYFNGPTHKSYLPKHVEDALPPLVLQNNNTAQLKSAVGKQAVITVLNLFSPGPATTYTGDKITRVLYDSARGDITMNNIYLSNCYLIIYDIIARKDIGNVLVDDPATCWTQGATDESAATAATIIGSTHFSIEAFNQFYKVAQVTNVVLGAGATHVHKVRLRPRKVVSSAFAQYTPYGIKDLTYWCMVEIHGSPANDITTQTAVSVGVGGLNIIQDREEVLKQLQKATPSYLITNNLPTSFAVGEQVVNLGGSTIVTQAEG